MSKRFGDGCPHGGEFGSSVVRDFEPSAMASLGKGAYETRVCIMRVCPSHKGRILRARAAKEAALGALRGLNIKSSRNTPSTKGATTGAKR